jgi:hypothetical protein
MRKRRTGTLFHHETPSRNSQFSPILLQSQHSFLLCNKIFTNARLLIALKYCCLNLVNMRNGIVIRGLGRRCFEPLPTDPNNTPSQQSQQQTPIPQDPTSIDTIPSESLPFSTPPSAHQLNTAQNEVLRKVSDLLKGKSGKVLDHDELVWENEVGLIVSAVDMAVNYLIFWPLVALRNRIQTFSTFGGKRLRDIFYDAIFVEGARGLYGGMAAHLGFQIVGIAKELARDRVLRWLDDRGFFESRRRRIWFRRVSAA